MEQLTQPSDQSTPVFMASVMKFQILSFGENGEAKLVEAEVFTAPPEGRASAAGIAAASPPHAGCADKTTPPV